MAQLALTGHNMDVTDALKELVETKFEKVQRHFDNITSAHVVLNVERINKHEVAEITIHIPGHQIHAKAATDDMYKSIDQMMKDLDRQVIKYKEKSSSHRD